MGTVPISVIYGHKYPLSPIPAPKAGPPTPPTTYRSSSVWPSCLDKTFREPPQVVQRRKYYQNGVTSNGVTSNGITGNGVTGNGITGNGVTTADAGDTVQKKTRGCLSYISSLRSRQTTTSTQQHNNTTTASTPVTSTASSFNASSYSYRKPNLTSTRSKTVDPNYSSHTSFHTSSYKTLSRATTVSPASAYSGYYGRSNVARAQDYRPATSWYRPSRFTLSSVTSSFTRFRSSFQTFKSRYF